MDENPVVAVAREVRADVASEAVRLSTGVRATLRPVSSSLIEEVVSRIEDPSIPKVINEEKGREEENPFDPAYLKACKEADRARARAATDATYMFGVELIDTIPDDGWERKLAFLGVEVDASDPLAREFAYKKHIAVAGPDLQRILELSGVSSREVNDALKVSPSSETANG